MSKMLAGAGLLRVMSFNRLIVSKLMFFVPTDSSQLLKDISDKEDN